MPKIITICGSLKFKDEMIKLAIQLQLKGNVALTPAFPVDSSKTNYTEEEISMLGKMHKEKIKLSDAIIVVDINNYVGEATKSEIEFAKSLNKEIIYYSKIKAKISKD